MRLEISCTDLVLSNSKYLVKRTMELIKSRSVKFLMLQLMLQKRGPASVQLTHFSPMSHNVTLD